MGWRSTKLKDICVVDWGDTSLTKKSYIEGGKFLAVSAAGCDGRIGHADHKACTPVLSAIGAQCGRMFYPEEPFTAIKNTITLTPVAGVADNRFLYHLLTYVDLPQRGAGQPFISKGDIQSFEVCIPEVAEQKRIVAILDRAFADIDKARALTEQNLKNARELFENYLQQVFSQRGEGWVECSLGDVAEFKNGLNFSKSSKGECVKIAGVKDFQSNYVISTDQFETAQIDGELSDSYELREGDILTVRSNGNKRLIGRCALIEKVTQKASFSGFIIRIRLIKHDVDPTFLTYYLKSSRVHEMLIGSGEGANISNLNQKTLTSLPVTYPTLDEQLELAAILGEVKEQSASLIDVYLEKLEMLKELKKSLLQKAFSGELTDSGAEAAA